MSLPNPERRLCRRRPTRGKVRVSCRKGAMDLGPDVAVSLLDFSESGVRLIAKCRLEPGEELAVTLEGPGNVKRIKRLGTVEWAVPTEAERWVLGVEFRQRLAHADLLHLT